LPDPLSAKPPVTLITTRVATERDYPAIARIQATCPEAAQWPTGDYANFPVLIAFAGTQPAGFCAWRQLGEDEAELLNLAVAPEARRRGVAGALLATLREIATGNIFLEVAETNTPAIALYRKFGWEPVGVRKDYYDRGTTNAVVMKKGSW
jgi:ribosomal-protein-alanine N-acetyltransferase